ncbi:MAG TPA: hypothetical protein VD931_07330 [Baekduia sp.]|nr:hypothetical protein [Baekduia sp.]
MDPDNGDRPEVMLAVAEAAAATGLTPKALRRRMERGSLRSVLVDGRRRIPLAELVRAGLLVTDAPTKPSDPHRRRPDDPLQNLGDALEARTIVHELLDRVERQSAELARLRLLAAHAERAKEAEVARLRRELEAVRGGRDEPASRRS